MRESCRPKHQALILRCYPKFQKNAADVKPNPSELSYLLYYASSRRSKLQKVGGFLEKRTTNDVYYGRIGYVELLSSSLGEIMELKLGPRYRNVQVTLQILKALIEKIPRDLPLYAQYILRILRVILRSKDITMMEETIPTLQKFCEHHVVATLAADQEHVEKYEEIVQTYAGFVADPSGSTKGPMTASLAIRWRSVGLHALQSMSSSEAVGADGGAQLNMIIPAILQNLHSDNGDYLVMLLQRAQTDETEDKELARRRMSIATVRTADTRREAESGTVSGNTDDADRLAEEEVACQALKCLKQIFVTSNRGQIWMATTAVLRFICNRRLQQGRGISQKSRSGSGSNWATTLMELASRWTPVQDRFVILVTTVETFIRSPVVEANLEQQLVLVTLVGWLLRSNINMIGLSVMDVLLGLVQHILLLLQLGGRGSNVLPHHQQTDAIDLFEATKDFVDRPPPPSPPPPSNSIEKVSSETEVTSPSANRQELLKRLQRCIGDLATHVYYSDQISDIIAAILLRLKPSPNSGISTVTAAIENPEAAARAISTSVKLQENPDTDEFFSFGTARVTALNAIKEVLIVANTKGTANNATAIGRNRVSVQVWEGTQWLLRDDDRRVRRAYVDALLTWLKLEMSKNDLRVMEDKRNIFKVPSKAGERSGWGHLTRRAVSNASQRERIRKPAKSTFLQLLHLAIYDNAIESPASESDVLLLHLLLVNLVEKLGVNAAKTGIPMIVRLQEDINDDQVISTPAAKMNIGSLVHGYFWALSEKFDFDISSVGLEIHSEINRRKSHGLWLDAIRLPPVPLDKIISASTLPLSEKLALPVIQMESLKPFDSLPAMVERIASAYTCSFASPPNSPPTSPGRAISMPILSNSSPPSSESELPSSIKDAMLAEWSKDICISRIEESPRTVSLNGSRTGTNLSARQKYLSINAHPTRNGTPTGAHSPNRTIPPNGAKTQELLPNGLTYSIQDPPQVRHSSIHESNSATPLSSSDQNQTLHIDDLKRVLAGSLVNSRGSSPLRNATSRRDFIKSPDQRSISTGSESAVSFESASEGYSSRLIPRAPTSTLGRVNPSIQNDRPRSASSRPQSLRNDSSGQNRPLTRSTMRPSSSSSSATEDPAANAKALRGDHVVSLPTAGSESADDDVPPVPPLPAGVVVHRNVGVGLSQAERPTSVGGASGGAETVGLAVAGNPRKKRGVDVSALLGSIDAIAVEGKGGGGMGKPPY
ncbi:plasma membrane localization protein [Sticta canariensis]|nr:plasma membrane localization protein [Sticta canariensis]